MAFAEINVSQGSVATHARCGGLFDIHLITNLPGNLPVKKNFNGLRFDRIMVMSLWSRFFGPPCITSRQEPMARCGPSRQEVETRNFQSPQFGINFQTEYIYFSPHSNFPTSQPTSIGAHRAGHVGLLLFDWRCRMN